MNLVAIVGPTALGKSSLALHLAGSLSGEIINADSRQVYRCLDIGTAKPTGEDQALVPHHLLDLVDPDQDFSLALYQSLAYRAVEDVARRGKLPFLVGGSGLYVWSVLAGWKLPGVPPNPELRAELLDQAEKRGYEVVYAELLKADPEAARHIDPRNVRRVIRALEVCHSGTLFSRDHGRRGEIPPSTLIIGLTAKREELYCRIDSRVDAMMERGLEDEVRELIKRGYRITLPSMSGIGYRQIGAYLEGKLSLPSAVQQMKFETHRFARHQYAWFRPGDERIHWMEAGADAERLAEDLLRRHLDRKECP
ncbi:MAG: tRNA dimethylallyltransferase [Dehalococcoidia bacterium]|nr:tRNA dimethylallyltransferase [Dehalococcoidia bacterium]